VSHVSLVRTISLGLKSLPPLLFRTSDVAFKSRELAQLHDEFFVFRTAKGYMTIEGMNCSVLVQVCGSRIPVRILSRTESQRKAAFTPDIDIMKVAVIHSGANLGS
jgi:hypothetical protein